MVRGEWTDAGERRVVEPERLAETGHRSFLFPAFCSSAFPLTFPLLAAAAAVIAVRRKDVTLCNKHVT